ncbi:tRNA (guanine-N1)-methyltransferase [Desulfonatronospira thiodismutans ASO3-1]|uniref:tRNA (guanine-N(1)-)-methyltransferase n=1 Tax=Desulfonatronospira thiodismutans ASO3-1 TaxID=555779 RepID=D6STI6_9BACT|nr:tRNA (guanine-N1)-methyltransferase [Desulfonatronospira thiodismutans ASO3-1]
MSLRPRWLQGSRQGVYFNPGTSVHFHIITLFPEYFDSPLSCGLMGKALEKDVLEVSRINPREFTRDRHRTVDDRPYGGGPGMVMLLDPLVQALNAMPPGCRKVLLTPKGKPLDQSLAASLAKENDLALVCGRYEGIDARLEELFDLDLVSAGDFVLNGGEAAALCLMESVARFLPGFLGKQESAGEESFSSGLLEYPHYTRPEEYAGLKVPEVLLSGDHGRIAAWRWQKALENTFRQRPELLTTRPLTSNDLDFLHGLQKTRPARNLYLALVHHPVKNKMGQESTTSLTNLDIHDIGRVCATYGLGGYYLCTPLKDQQVLARRLLSHWREGPGARANPDRALALAGVNVVSSLQDAVENVESLAGRRPRIVATSASGAGDIDCGQVFERLEKEPVLMVLGTGYGLSDRVVQEADNLLTPLRLLGGYNHLSVRSAASTIVDRILGDFA